MIDTDAFFDNLFVPDQQYNIQLLDKNGNIVDALGYGNPTPFLGEGTPVTGIQDPDESISRDQFETDTNDNFDDFLITTDLTPGYPNRYLSEDCIGAVELTPGTVMLDMGPPSKDDFEFVYHDVGWIGEVPEPLACEGIFFEKDDGDPMTMPVARRFRCESGEGCIPDPGCGVDITGNPLVCCTPVGKPMQIPSIDYCIFDVGDKIYKLTLTEKTPVTLAVLGPDGDCPMMKLVKAADDTTDGCTNGQMTVKPIACGCNLLHSGDLDAGTYYVYVDLTETINDSTGDKGAGDLNPIFVLYKKELLTPSLIKDLFIWSLYDFDALKAILVKMQENQKSQ
jgi:hypothetical protein